MTITKSFAAVILDHERIHEINTIIVKYSDSSRQSSSHLQFNIDPVNITQITQDLTFFIISGENEKEINDKIDKIVNDLNEIDADYSIRDVETGKIITTVSSVSAIYIKFDNFKAVPEGTYEKIDKLKNKKMSAGYTVGYKPLFRPLESKEIRDIDIQNETLYLFARTPEKQINLKDDLIAKINEINPNLITEYKSFV